MKRIIILSFICISCISLLITISGCGGGSGTTTVPVQVVATNTPVNEPTTPSIKYGNISGQILNNTGAGYANAFVIFQSLVVSEKMESSGLYTRSTIADVNGYYSFNNVPQGACGVYFWASQSDYQTNQNTPLGSVITAVSDNTNGVILQQGQVAPTPTPTTATQPGTTPTATKTPLPGSTSTPTPIPGNFTVKSSTTSGHTHNITVLSSDLINPPSSGKTYTSTTADGHTHNIFLSQAQFIDVNNGNTVTVTSSSANGHTHTWTIMKSFTVTSSVTDSHTHNLVVNMADLSNPPVSGVTYTSSTTNGHNHNIFLTQSQLININNGNTVNVTSSSNNGHTHSWTIVNTNPSPTPTNTPVTGTLPAPMWSGTGVVPGVYSNGNVKIILNWVTIMSAECTGYVIQRARTGIDVTQTPTTFDNIVTLSGKDIASYNDSNGLNTGYKYWYRIAGKNSKGEIGLWSSVRSTTVLSSNVITNPNAATELSVYLDTSGNIIGTWKYVSPNLGSNWYSGANVVINTSSNPAGGTVRNEGFISYPTNSCNLTALWPSSMGNIPLTTTLYFHVKTVNLWGLESTYVTYGPFSINSLLNGYILK